MNEDDLRALIYGVVVVVIIIVIAAVVVSIRIYS